MQHPCICWWWWSNALSFACASGGDYLTARLLGGCWPLRGAEVLHRFPSSSSASSFARVTAKPKGALLFAAKRVFGERGGSASVIRVANNKCDTVLYPSAARSISFRQLPASLSDKIQVYWAPHCAIRVGRNRSLRAPSLGCGARCGGKQQKDAAGWRCSGLWAGGYREGLEMDFTFWPDRASLILAPTSGTWSCKMNFLFNIENAKILH